MDANRQNRVVVNWLAALAACGGVIGFAVSDRGDVVSLLGGLILAALIVAVGVLIEIRDKA